MRLSLDAGIAVLGGLTALIWQMIGLLIGWHQDFSFSNELGLSLFTREKKGHGSKEADQSSVSKAEAAVLNREPHDWCVGRFTLGYLMPYVCCCFRGTDWFKERKKLVD